MTRRLVIFTRYPEPGKTKTRLIPALGPDGAAHLQRQMTRHTLRWAGRLQCPGSTSVEVRFEGGDAAARRTVFGPRFPYRPQGGGDLGCRLDRAFQTAFAEGVRRTVVVGSDCPGVSDGVVENAFGRLARQDLVLGPAGDGGYYLIGLKRPVPALFAEIPWGQGDVLDRTLDAAQRLGLDSSLLDPLDDVDRPQDLAHWQAVKTRNFAPGEDRISVVIPTLDEAEELAATLDSIDRGGDAEVIVVDAGSRDHTCRIAGRGGALVLGGVQGRGRQMNAGAAVAGGRYLLFLHADTCLPPGFDGQVRRTLESPGVAAGAFALRIRHAAGSLKLIERSANFRARRLQMPYGDQSLFLRAETFHRVGGFPDLPIMEDFCLVRSLRKEGRIRILPAAATTSDRRWRALGPWRTTVINQLVVLGYHLGISPRTLANWYRRP